MGDPDAQHEVASPAVEGVVPEGVQQAPFTHASFGLQHRPPELDESVIGPALAVSVTDGYVTPHAENPGNVADVVCVAANAWAGRA
jgi:hypothetical protein